MLAEANIVALRGWKLSCVALWAAGPWLVFRWGGSRLYFGAFITTLLLRRLEPWTPVR
jgi:hypothetical protein